MTIHSSQDMKIQRKFTLTLIPRHPLQKITLSLREIVDGKVIVHIFYTDTTEAVLEAGGAADMLMWASVQRS